MIYLILSYISLMFSGILWGAREAVHADRGIFHYLFKNIEDISFFGKKQWLMKDKYDNRVISQLLDWFPINDYWHSSHYIMQVLTPTSFWLVYHSDNVFWDFTNYLPNLIWFIVITMFWGGVTYSLFRTHVKKNKN